jgi:hypothetical protein
MLAYSDAMLLACWVCAEGDCLRVLGLWLVLLLTGLTACSPATSRVVVEWTTASEINTSGFNLYRSERAEGPYVKINAQVIPASTDPLVGGQYRFEDVTVTAGQTYYYELEDVELDGASTRHGPIVVTASGGWNLGGSRGMLWLLSLGALAVVCGVLLARGRKKREIKPE